MKGFIRKISLLLVLISILLTGCGEKLLELSEQDTDLVVKMSSSAISRANKMQGKGLVNLSEEPKLEPDPVVEEPEEQKPAIEEEKTKENNESTEKKEPDVNQPEEKNVTLTEAINMQNVELSYQGYDLIKQYEDNSFFLEADEGKVFLVLKVLVTNVTSEAVDCDMLSVQQKYHININNEEKDEGQMTLLLNDLGTLVQTLQPGESIETVLLFPISENISQNINQLQLSVIENGAETKVDIQ